MIGCTGAVEFLPLAQKEMDLLQDLEADGPGTESVQLQLEPSSLLSPPSIMPPPPLTLGS